MALDFYADIDGRQARIIAIDMSTPVGIDLDLDSQTGSIELGVALETQNVVADVSFNEFLSIDKEASIETEFVGQLDTILGLVDIDGLLGDLNVSLPAIVLGDEAIGIENMLVKGTGSAQEDLTIYADLGPVSYGSGCDSEEGCEGGGFVRTDVT